MVKTPRTRHSKSSKKPVTIDHEPEEPIEQEAVVADPVSDKVDEEIPAKGNEIADAKEQAESDTPPTDTVEGKPEINSRKQTSTPALIAAGFVGGVLALGGGAAIGWLGPWGDNGSPSPELTSLQGEVADLKSQLQAGINAASRNAEEAAKNAVSSAMSDVDSKLDENAAQVAALTQDIDELRGAIESGGAGDGAALQALKDRLTGLEEKIAALDASPPADGASQESLANLDNRIVELEKSISATSDVAEKALQSSESVTTAISALESKLDTLAQRVDQQAANPEVALAIAAAALKSAIDRGLPFMTELETYAAIAPDAPEIAALRDLAASGVPTRTDITAEMATVADAMIAAMNISDPDDGLFQRLLSSAQSLIKVRPIGMVEGDTPAAIIARMEVAVSGNDYARALAEYDSLPDAAKKAGESFAAKIEARMKADELIDKALAAALKPS